ncbi:hypothetical protein F5051DRAFT_446540 [Lentinula edodes]|nr:hypothetical protein F5051DRAFT_446540 [Lentinula edodes]
MPKRFGNVEATPHVKLRAASSLPPPTTRGRPPSSPAPRDLPSRVYTSSGAYTLETHLHLQPTQSYIDVLASTTPTTQYRTGPPGPPRNPLQGHHLIVPATTRSFPSLVAVLVAPFELQPAHSTLQHKLPHTKPYLKTYFDPGLTVRYTTTRLPLCPFPSPIAPRSAPSPPRLSPLLLHPSPLPAPFLPFPSLLLLLLPLLLHSPPLFSVTSAVAANELAPFLCERERKESNGHSNQPI